VNLNFKLNSLRLAASLPVAAETTIFVEIGREIVEREGYKNCDPPKKQKSVDISTISSIGHRKLL